MINVAVVYDTSSFTWNIMVGLECVFYGSADECDKWIENNKSKYVELK